MHDIIPRYLGCGKNTKAHQWSEIHGAAPGLYVWFARSQVPGGTECLLPILGRSAGYGKRERGHGAWACLQFGCQDRRRRYRVCQRLLGTAYQRCIERLPYAQSRPRAYTEEINKSKVTNITQHPYHNTHVGKVLCDVYDIIFAPETLARGRDPAFRTLLMETALDAVNATLLKTFSPKFENKDLTKLSPLALRDIQAPVRLARVPQANAVRYTPEDKQVMLQAMQHQQVPLQKRTKQMKDVIARSEQIQKNALANAK